MSLASSVASMLNTKEPVSAALAYYDPVLGEEAKKFGAYDSNDAFFKYKTMNPIGYQAFQYYPEKISDSKSVEYTSKSIPGGSHPIYTFISGGERTISFDAIFVNDEGPPLSVLEGGLRIATWKPRKEVQDVAGGIKWLRYCLYPTYKNGVAKAPPLVILYLPESGIIGDGNKKNSVIGILTRADVTYESFYRNGTPRLAVVSCEIKEVVQTQKKWQFTDGNTINVPHLPTTDYPKLKGVYSNPVKANK
jgi:hypothetical protein